MVLLIWQIFSPGSQQFISCLSDIHGKVENLGDILEMQSNMDKCFFHKVVTDFILKFQ